MRAVGRLFDSQSSRLANRAYFSSCTMTLPRLTVPRLRIVDDQLEVRRLGPDLREVRDAFRRSAITKQAAVLV